MFGFDVDGPVKDLLACLRQILCEIRDWRLEMKEHQVWFKAAMEEERRRHAVRMGE